LCMQIFYGNGISIFNQNFKLEPQPVFFYYSLVLLFLIKKFSWSVCEFYLLRDVNNTICRRSWYIAAHIWKIYDFKLEVVPFIINCTTELTTVVIYSVSAETMINDAFSYIWKCIRIRKSTKMSFFFINRQNQSTTGKLKTVMTLTWYRHF
jgi:hypothetical protein